jgi:integrase/recombinase XerD
MDSIQKTTYKNYLSAKGYSTSTAEGMINYADRFLIWIKEQNLELSTMTYNDMTEFIKYNRQRGIKSVSAQRILLNAQHYLNYLVEAGQLSHNPALSLKLKNTKHKAVYNILIPEELEHIYKSYPAQLSDVPNGPPQLLNKLARKRNKIVLGILVYQGVAAGDLKNIELKHLALREGQITIPGTKRSNERTLKLEPHQIFDLYDYVNETRKELLQLTHKQSNQLFTSAGTGTKLHNALQKLVAELKQHNKNIESLDQIRASIITSWLKHYNKRKVQYMAGHKYVSSTEAYEASNIEALQEDIQRFYPTF